jgi:DNA-binding NarL/FixJ family response regulator
MPFPGCNDESMNAATGIGSRELSPRREPPLAIVCAGSRHRRRHLRRGCELAGFTVSSQVSRPRRAVLRAINEFPSLVMFAVRPTNEAIIATAQLQLLRPATGVIVLTDDQHVDEFYAVARAGADAYASLRTGVADLADICRHVAAGGVSYAGQFSESGADVNLWLHSQETAGVEKPRRSSIGIVLTKSPV